jgi:hypothetical protein
VSAYRDSLPAGARERYDAAWEAAWDGFATVLAAGCDAKDQLYLEGGAEAVAEAAYIPGGPAREQIAAVYMGMRAGARAARQARERGTAA